MRQTFRMQPSTSAAGLWVMLASVTMARLCAPGVASPVPFVVELTSPEEFERQTQASTGQTTGNWFVLFLSETNAPEACHRAVASLESLADRQLGSVIWAKMNIDPHPELVKRFNLHSYPVGILFKDRKMYVWVLDAAETTPEKILDFVETVSDEREGEMVPGVPSAMNALVELFEKRTGKSRGLLYGGLVALAGFALLIISGWLRIRRAPTTKTD